MEQNTTPGEKADELDIKKFMIKKLPSNGKAMNAIDKFLLIGYDSNFIERELPQILEEEKKKGNISPENPDFFIEEKPRVIFEVVNDYEKELLDNDIIINLLFPTNVKGRVLQSVSNNIDFEGLRSEVIFSINPQDNEGSKKSYNGFGYPFFIPSKINNTYVVLPKIFFFLSEYPLFFSFSEFGKALEAMIKATMNLPLESFLYNIIHSLPAPLKFSINISISNSKEKRKKEEKEKEEEKRKNKEEKEMRETIGYYPKIEREDVFFSQLSSFPLCEINLSIILTFFGPEKFLEIFLFSFFEYDIIFVSPCLELLNALMYSISLLNFPFNDTIYYWHVLSVSFKDFINGSSSFVGKTCSSMIGICGAYDPSMKSELIKEGFICSMNEPNGVIKIDYESSEPNSPSAQNTLRLRDFFRGIIKNPDGSHSSGSFSEIVDSLCKNVKAIYKKIIFLYQKTKKINLSKIFSRESETTINKSLQTAFYKFSMDIMKKFSSGIQIIPYPLNEDDVSEVEKEFSNFSRVNIGNKNYTVGYKDPGEEKEIDKIFIEKFRETSKFNSYIINFTMFFESIDLFKTPFTFTEEIINSSKRWESKKPLSEQNIFEPSLIYDTFAEFKTQEELRNLFKKGFINKTTDEIKDLNISEFFTQNEQILDHCCRETVEYPLIFEKPKKGYFKYNIKLGCFEFSQELLIDYIYFLQSDKTYPESLLKFEVSDKIEEVDNLLISELLEQIEILKKSLNLKDLLNISLFLVVSLTLEIELEKETQNLALKVIDFLPKCGNFLYSRKYCIILLKIYSLIILRLRKNNNIPKNKKEETEKKIKKIYFRIIQKFTQFEVSPNKELIYYLNLFERPEEDEFNRLPYKERLHAVKKEDLPKSEEESDLKKVNVNFEYVGIKGFEENNIIYFFSTRANQTYADEVFSRLTSEDFVDWKKVKISILTESEVEKLEKSKKIKKEKSALEKEGGKNGNDKSENDILNQNPEKEVEVEVENKKKDYQIVKCSFEDGEEEINLCSPKRLFNLSKKIIFKYMSGDISTIKKYSEAINKIICNLLYYVNRTCKTFKSNKKFFNSGNLIYLQYLYSESEKEEKSRILIEAYKLINNNLKSMLY